MKVLLDTHIWIWYLAGSGKLTPVFREIIENKKNEIWLSPISVWEAMVLGERGRIELKPDPVSWVREALKTGGFREAPINIEIAIKSRQLDLSHQDPADRFLVATTLIYDLQLATADKTLLKTKWLPTVLRV